MRMDGWLDGESPTSCIVPALASQFHEYSCVNYRAGAEGYVLRVCECLWESSRHSRRCAGRFSGSGLLCRWGWWSGTGPGPSGAPRLELGPSGASADLPPTWSRPQRSAETHMVTNTESFLLSSFSFFSSIISPNVWRKKEWIKV